MSLTDEGHYGPKLLNLLKNGQAVDEIAQIVAYRGMSVGKYNSDLMAIIQNTIADDFSFI